MSLFSRVNDYAKTNSFINIARKTIYYLLMKMQVIADLLRKLRFYFFTRCWISNIAAGIVVRGFGSNMYIGKESTLYSNAIFEFGPNGKLQIGNHFTCSYGTLIACNGQVTIGDDVMVGEYCSIRDSTHLYDNPDLPFSRQPDKMGKIIIGNNVWIGRGCIVLPETEIESGVIIAANSVVKGKIAANGIYGGSPAKLIRQIYPEAVRDKT